MLKSYNKSQSFRYSLSKYSWHDQSWQKNNTRVPLMWCCKLNLLKTITTWLELNLRKWNLYVNSQNLQQINKRFLLSNLTIQFSIYPVVSILNHTIYPLLDFSFPIFSFFNFSHFFFLQPSFLDFSDFPTIFSSKLQYFFIFGFHFSHKPPPIPPFTARQKHL